MSDVLTIAMRRHEMLQAELIKIDRFLRMAVELSKLKSTGTEAGRPTEAPSSIPVEPKVECDCSVAQSAAPEKAEKPRFDDRPTLFRGAFRADEGERLVVNR